MEIILDLELWSSWRFQESSRDNKIKLWIATEDSKTKEIKLDTHATCMVYRYQGEVAGVLF